VTVEDIEACLWRIEQDKGDPEAAHTREDVLHSEVLRQIANGAENAQELARAALRSHSIDFPRWGG
jgi:hypothetical protein